MATARFLKDVWPFYNIMHERVKIIIWSNGFKLLLPLGPPFVNMYTKPKNRMKELQTVAFLEPYQTCIVELFIAKIINSFNQLTILAKKLHYWYLLCF